MEDMTKRISVYGEAKRAKGGVTYDVSVCKIGDWANAQIQKGV